MLTKFEFRQRFTVAERVGIELAGVDNPSLPIDHPARVMAATLRVFQGDLNSVDGEVDETHPETITGVQQLEQFGLIGPGRAAQILAPAGGQYSGPESSFVFDADAVAIHGLRVATAGVYAAHDLVACYRDGDESKTPVAAYSARYIATGED